MPRQQSTRWRPRRHRRKRVFVQKLILGMRTRPRFASLIYDWPAVCQRLANGVEQDLLAQRLGQIRGDAAGDGPSSLTARRASCYQNCRYSASRGDQVIVKRHAGHFRHPYIEDKTRCTTRFGPTQELFGRREDGCSKSVRFQHALQSVANRLVVVHDRNQRLHRQHAYPCAGQTILRVPPRDRSAMKTQG